MHKIQSIYKQFKNVHTVLQTKNSNWIIINYDITGMSRVLAKCYSNPTRFTDLFGQLCWTGCEVDNHVFDVMERVRSMNLSGKPLSID